MGKKFERCLREWKTSHPLPCRFLLCTLLCPAPTFVCKVQWLSRKQRKDTAGKGKGKKSQTAISHRAFSFINIGFISIVLWSVCFLCFLLQLALCEVCHHDGTQSGSLCAQTASAEAYRLVAMCHSKSHLVDREVAFGPYEHGQRGGRSGFRNPMRDLRVW